MPESEAGIAERARRLRAEYEASRDRTDRGLEGLALEILLHLPGPASEPVIFGVGKDGRVAGLRYEGSKAREAIAARAKDDAWWTALARRPDALQSGLLTLEIHDRIFGRRAFPRLRIERPAVAAFDYARETAEAKRDWEKEKRKLELP